MGHFWHTTYSKGYKNRSTVKVNAYKKMIKRERDQNMISGKPQTYFTFPADFDDIARRCY